MKPESTAPPSFEPRFAAPGLRTGFDIAEVRTVAHALRHFGRRYADRVYTAGEQAYALSGTGLVAERLAARFAAKEAVMKALSLSEVGVDWRDIEVIKRADGSCAVALHGRARDTARALGVQDLQLSLSHDGGYAGAFVAAWLGAPSSPQLQEGTEP